MDQVLASLKFPTLGIYLPDLHRVRGDALAAIGPANAQGAREALNRALELARGQGSPVFEVRALMSLLASGAADDPSATQAALQDVYDGFTEGFDCPDLVRAREFLGSNRIRMSGTE